MGRRRKAWLVGGTGRRVQRGKTLPGWYAEWRDYSGPSPVHRSRCFASAKAARDFVRRFNARLDLGEGDVLPASILEVKTDFGLSLSGLALETVAEYGRVIAALGKQAGDRPISSLVARDIDLYVTRRSGVSAATVAKDLRIISRFFVWAMQAGYAVSNPTLAALQRVKVRPRARPLLSDADIARLVAAVDTEDRRIAIWLAMTTGLDRGVIERMTVGDIDLADMCIRVVRPKTGKVLSVPIHSALVSVLSQKLDQRPRSARLLAGLSHQWHRDGSPDWWSRAREAAGLPGVLFRDLRAVAAVRLQRSGASVGDAQRLLGHADPMTTMRHYSIPDPAIRSRIDAMPLPGLREAPAQTAG